VAQAQGDCIHARGGWQAAADFRIAPLACLCFTLAQMKALLWWSLLTLTVTSLAVEGDRSKSECVHFRFSVETDYGGPKGITESEWWRKGDLVRAEYPSLEHGTSVTIETSNTVYSFVKGEREGMRIPKNASGTFLQDPLAVWRRIKIHEKNTGVEAVEKIPCDKYEVEGSGWHAVMWIAPATGLPVKSVVKTTSGATLGALTYRFSKIEVNCNFPDDLFVPPAGIVFEDSPPRDAGK
jgi:hypothetical protein